ncbi:hypothetical protein FKE98_11840 [Corynebacterium aurimucosum]|uniref:hypothetical protein n=1 Tax=Corynebacterium guaraldiae TaxID=3051103 RepID=UPI0012B99B74|nr:hypothetical protein [Corynebacterium guaraldiae]MTE11041.1 hypothetical protein [Corynebacterium guaraldiae]
MLVDFIHCGRDALYVCCGWCMPDGAFLSSGVIVNNISCLGVNDLKSSDFASLLLCPVGLGVGFEIFSLCNFWIASSGDAAFVVLFVVVCLFV